MFHPISNDYDLAKLIKTLPQRMDLSCVRTLHDQKELQSLAEASIKYRPACAFVLPAFVDQLAEKLKDYPEVKVGGVVSFPSGGDTTEQKVFQTKDLCRKGCGEIDMVMNVTMLRTEQYSSCLADISGVVQAADGIPVKVIIEACLLSEDEICRASELAVKAGATYVKTGTGWVGAASVRQVELIYQTIGNDAFIKAAGGIRSLSDVKALYQAGCDRFGVGAGHAADIFNESGFQ